jgi:hypothetical protein
VSDFISEIAVEIRAAVDPKAAPEHPEGLRLFRLYALLALVKGDKTSREDVHNAWIVWMVEVDGDHDALKPYGELTDEQRNQDQPFLDAIHEVALRLGING